MSWTMRPLALHLAVAGEEVVDRHLVQLLGDRLGLVGAGRLDRPSDTAVTAE